MRVAFVVAILLGFSTLTSTSAEMAWRRGEVGDPGSLDPHKTSTVVEANVIDELFEGLVAYDGEGKLVPAAAERWEIAEDAAHYTFHLRADGRWSNGDPVVADDFVFAFRRLMKPETGAEYANILYTLKNAEAVNKGRAAPEALGIKAIDPHLLQIELERPTPYFLEQLAHLTAKPLHRASVERYGESFVRPGRLISNGPFLLQDFMPNDRLVLVKNPSYYDAAKIRLDKEVFVPLEDRSAALRRFMAGEIDSYDDVPLDQVRFVRQTFGEAFKVGPTLASYYYAFDTRHPPFDDARVRTALAMVIDREFLAQVIWGGTMAASYSFVPPGIASYGPAAKAPWAAMSPFDREDAAKRLLAEAGYGPGKKRLPLEFRYNTSENHRATAIAIADMLKVLDVDMRLYVTDATSHYAFLRSKAPFDLARSGWFADYPDAQNFLFLGESDNKALNVANFTDPAYDTLMRRAAGETEPAQRAKILHEAEARLLAAQPYLVLMSYQSRNLVSPKLKGWQVNAVDHHPGRDVWIDP